MNQTPVGTRNDGYTITSAVRMHSEGVGNPDFFHEDYWVVLGHDDDGVMVSWQCRWQQILSEKKLAYRWTFYGGHYADDALSGFRNRIRYELNKMVTRSESCRDEAKKNKKNEGSEEE